jgi:putative Ca2+/H+ antiporter (TMEM165/GDT1 family)
LNWNLFTSTFGLIFLAELPDKTAFATLMLAGEGKLSALFLGAASAFLIHVTVSP